MCRDPDISALGWLSGTARTEVNKHMGTILTSIDADLDSKRAGGGGRGAPPAHAHRPQLTGGRSEDRDIRESLREL
eukprot:1307196-Pyramimonas_sp.AAC.1